MRAVDAIEGGSLTTLLDKYAGLAQHPPWSEDPVRMAGLHQTRRAAAISIQVLTLRPGSGWIHCLDLLESIKPFNFTWCQT